MYGDHPHLHSFPTRRSSDLAEPDHTALDQPAHPRAVPGLDHAVAGDRGAPATDRKSTRLNSSHQIISYAVLCLKTKRPHQLTADWRSKAVLAPPSVIHIAGI